MRLASRDIVSLLRVRQIRYRTRDSDNYETDVAYRSLLTSQVTACVESYIISS